MHLFYRKARANGNFSLEISFDQMMAHFPLKSPFTLRKIKSSYLSNGTIKRVLAILEARKYQGSINHVIGDIHFLVLGLPKNNTILTIHDCGFMQHPSRVARLILKWFWLTLPIQRCRWITAVSEATKQDILRLTNCSSEKIKVIPTIINNQFQKKKTLFNKRRPRILHIGLAKNKNFGRHIEAIAGLDCQLHIIGKLNAAHKQLLLNYQIDYLESYNISQTAIQKAYEDCDILLFASTLEGFGMPIIEAQTVGCPVITSNLSSMPEVAGKGAFFVNPYEVESIRQGIIKIIENDALREQLIVEGFENIKRFQAAKIAQQYEALYQLI